MPTAKQAQLTYPGIKNIISWIYARTPGISPNVCSITATPQVGLFRQGNIKIQYGSATIRMRDCVVDKATSNISRSGEHLQTINIYDRRWRWKDTGRISGYYNVRRFGSATIPEGHQTTPRELARLCLDAMGERGFKIDRMPNTARPQIEWDYANPSESLQALCDLIQCVIILRIDDVVEIVPADFGGVMPPSGTVIKDAATSDPPEKPDAAVIVGAPTKYQVDLVLEPVAQDIDGTIRPINDLSYIPGNGEPGNWWANIDIDTMRQVVAGRGRDLALQQVFRWYRIARVTYLPGNAEPVTGRYRILPLLEDQVETMTNEDGTEGPKPPVVYGYWEGDSSASGTVAVPVGDGGAPAQQPQYYNDFEIDHRNGIVKFADPVFSMFWLAAPILRAPGNIVVPPLLTLRIGVNLRDEQTRGWERPEYKAILPGPRLGTLPLYRVYDDVALELWTDENGRFQENENETRRAALGYLADIRKLFRTKSPRQVEYVGIVPWNCDGAIRQVEWSQNGEGSFTKISKDVEDPGIGLTTVERREIEEQRRQQRIARRTSDQTRRDLEREGW